MRSSKTGFLMLSLVVLGMLPGSAIAQTAAVATSEQGAAHTCTGEPGGRPRTGGA